MKKEYVYVQISVSELARLSNIVGDRFTMSITFCEKQHAEVEYNDGKISFLYETSDKDIMFLNKSINPKYKSVFLRCPIEDIGSDSSRISFKINTFDNILFLVSYPYCEAEKNERILFDSYTGVYPNCFVVHDNNIYKDENDNTKIRKYNRCYTMIYDKCIVNPIFINNETINKKRLSGPWIEASLLYKYVEKYEHNNNLLSYNEVEIMFEEFERNLNKAMNKDSFYEIIIPKRIAEKYDFKIKHKDDYIASISGGYVNVSGKSELLIDKNSYYIRIYDEYGTIHIEYDGKKLVPIKGCRIDRSMTEFNRFAMFNVSYDEVKCSLNLDSEFSIDKNKPITICILDSFKVSNMIFDEFIFEGDYVLSKYKGYFNRFYDVCSE